MTPRALRSMSARATFDGRWIVLALLACYFAALALTGPLTTFYQRWRHAGVYAQTPAFIDLHVFAAAQTELAGGGDPYVSNPTDPQRRPFNYPRVWLTFMRFTATPNVIATIGVAFALAALTAVLAFWGRLTPGEGIFGGLLLCSPAVMLGVERGNTDLLIFALVALGLGVRGRIASVVWLLAAALKLFPVLAFGALLDRSWRAWTRKVAVPLALFALYLIYTFHDLGFVLRNTGAGWVQSYGAKVPVAAAVQALRYYGLGAIDFQRWALTATLIALGGLGAAVLIGWRLGPAPEPASVLPEDHDAPVASTPALRLLTGFRIGALIYVTTFLVGTSFDYRQCFLLLTVPQLFLWVREPRGARRTLAVVALGSLLLSVGMNYVVAGWPGFFINETAGWALFFVLGALLAATWAEAWHRPESSATLPL